MVRFSKFTLKKEIYEKFEEFPSKLVWRKTLFFIKTRKINLNQPSLAAKSLRVPIHMSYAL